MASSENKLTPLQEDLLQGFFEREQGFFLSGGAALGAAMVVRQQATGFHRYIVSRGQDAVIVDMVLDRVPQIHVEKWERDGLRIDPPEEIPAPWIEEGGLDLAPDLRP